MYAEIKTVGELKEFLADCSDDMPVWLGGTVVEGGLHYYDSPSKYSVEVMADTQTFGVFLPPEKQTKETGLVIY